MDAKIEEGEGHDAIVVYLSRRNLEVLLAKLDGNPPDSACTIFREFDRSTTLVVMAQENDAHYGDRKPGPMHETTERAIFA